MWLMTKFRKLNTERICVDLEAAAPTPGEAAPAPTPGPGEAAAPTPGTECVPTIDIPCRRRYSDKDIPTKSYSYHSCATFLLGEVFRSITCSCVCEAC